MPPRSDLDHDNCTTEDASSLAIKQPSSSSSSSRPKNKSKPKSSFERRRRPRVLFKSTHGISGVLSTLLTILAIISTTHQQLLRQQLLQQQQQQTIPSPPSQRPSSSSSNNNSSSDSSLVVTVTTTCSSITSILAVMASILTASSGINIVDQAPKQTVVMEHPIRVIPPHRDAFRRTAFSVYYLGARICWNAVPELIHTLLEGNDDSSTSSSNNNNNTGGSSSGSEEDANCGIIHWIWSIATLIYALKYFLPHPSELEWKNGNTYVFVLPMAMGLTVDAFYQLPILQCHHRYNITTYNNDNDNDTTTTTTTNICWNEDVITQLDLLYVLLSGLLVAFVFTLAFRGVLGVKKCYWGAAAVVHGIVFCLVGKALPFVIMYE